MLPPACVLLVYKSKKVKSEKYILLSLLKKCDIARVSVLSVPSVFQRYTLVILHKAFTIRLICILANMICLVVNLLLQLTEEDTDANLKVLWYSLVSIVFRSLEWT